VDYLKYDLCSLTPAMIASGSLKAAQMIQQTAYSKMGQALKATGRPIVYSLCQYGFNQVWRWGPDVGGDLWRTTGDIEDKFPRMVRIGFGQAGLSKYAGHGRWNDPDMLEIGNGGMTDVEYRTHMSLWSLLAAPLLAGNDLATMSAETRVILTNPEVIAIDQDPAGLQGDRFAAEGPLETWVKPLSGGAKAVGLFNLADFPEAMSVDAAALGFKGPVKARDLWTHSDLGSRATYSAVVPGHGVLLLRLTPTTP
jgi:alpha-galactosidase